MEKMCRITSSDGNEAIIPERLIYEAVPEKQILKWYMRSNKLKANKKEILKKIKERSL